MSNFIAQCPHCNRQFNAQSEWIGQNTNCPSCGKLFTIQQEKPTSLQKRFNFRNNYLIIGCVVIGFSILGGIFGIYYDSYQMEKINQTKAMRTTKDIYDENDKIQYIVIDTAASFFKGMVFCNFFTYNYEYAEKIFYRQCGTQDIARRMKTYRWHKEVNDRVAELNR